MTWRLLLERRRRLTFPRAPAKHPAVKVLVLFTALVALLSQELRANPVLLDQGGLQFDLPPEFGALTDDQRHSMMPQLDGSDVKVLRDVGSPVVVIGDVMRFSIDEASFEKSRMGMALFGKMGDDSSLIHNDFTLINGTRWLYTDIIRKKVRMVMLETRYRGHLATIMAIVPSASFDQYKALVTNMAMSLKLDPVRSATELPYVEFDPAKDSMGLLK